MISQTIGEKVIARNVCFRKIIIFADIIIVVAVAVESVANFSCLMDLLASVFL